MNFRLKPSTAVGRAVLQHLKIGDESHHAKPPPHPNSLEPGGNHLEEHEAAPNLEKALRRMESVLHTPAGNSWRVFTRTISKNHVEKMDLNLYPNEEPGPVPAEGLSGATIAEVVRVLRQGSEEDRREAAEFLRGQCKESVEVRQAVVAAGGVEVLVELTRASDALTVENTVTALHNLALTEAVHPALMKPSVLEALISVLRSGTPTAQANAAATFFNLSRNLRQAETIVQHTGLYRPLVNLLRGETLRGKKDAAYAMCYISLVSRGRRELVEAGAVEALVEILTAGVEGMEEKAVAVLGNIAKSKEGLEALMEADAVDVLAELLLSESVRSREDATSALLLLANHSAEGCQLVLDAGVVPDLIAVSRSEKTSAKGQLKAKSLVQLLRSKTREARGVVHPLIESAPSGEFQISFTSVESR